MWSTIPFSYEDLCLAENLSAPGYIDGARCTSRRTVEIQSSLSPAGAAILPGLNEVGAWSPQISNKPHLRS